MPASSYPPRRRVALCLAALLLWAVSGRQPRAAWAQALTLDACGAFQVPTAPGDAWPGAKAVRLGESVLPGDKGLGCRFVLTGEPAGAAAVVEVRLTRPGSGGEPVEDRWFVPVRRGETAVAAYGFAPGQPATAGSWSLSLAGGGVSPVTARFVVAPSPEASAPPPQAGKAPAAPPPLPDAHPLGPPSVPAQMIESAPAAAPTPGARPTAAPPAAPSPGTNPPTAPQPSAATAPEGPPAAAKPAAPAAAESAVRARTQPPPPAAPHPAAAAKPTASAGYVSLQTGLFADADNAAAQAARLRSRGMPACLSVSGDAAKRRYRVLAGRFGDRRTAADARPAVTAILGLTPIVYDVEPSEAARLRCR